MTIKDLKPAGVWNAFYALTQIPRPSGHTEAVANFLVNFAKENGAEAFIDDAGNVVMRAAATPGYESRECVVLQAHMDMVPQKLDSKQHNFETDPIETWIDGDWVKAKDTTLGADDGMGVAFAMAIIADKDIPHGPLEVLVTRDEETGMYGAFALKPGELKGKYLLNIDSETEGEITIGCAGGMDINASLEYKEESVDAEGLKAYSIEIDGLLGGHSGLEINQGRANANKLLARVLFELVSKQDMQLCTWTGGNMRNAIPRSGKAVVICDAEDAQALIDTVKKCEAIFQNEYKDIEKEPVTITVNECDVPAMAIPEEIGVNIVNAVMSARDGVLRYIPTIPSIVETSVNLSIINVGEGKAEIAMLARSATDSVKEYLCNELVAGFSMAGMKVSLTGGYSGWQPNTSSPFVALMGDVYKKMYGEEAKVLVVHAGLECGILGPKYPDMDMASIGPTLLSPHTPSERCYIPSIGRSFDYICEILKEIPERA